MLIRRRGLLTAVLSIALILVVGRAWGALVGDHAWFSAQGFADIWWWRTTVSLLLKFAAGTVATLVMRAHLEAIRRSFVSVVVPGNLGNLEFTGAVPDRTISLVLWALAVLVGLLLTIPITEWVPFAAVLDAQPLGEADPYFQYDLAFWTSWLPFELQMYTWALVAHASISMLVVVGYVLTRGIGTDGRLLRVSRHARRHVTALGAILLVLIAWSYRLDGFDRLIFGSGTAGEFGFADHRVGLPGGIIMQVISLAAAGVVVWSAWSRQPRAGIAAVTTVLLMALLLRQGLPLIAESLDGGSDTVARERRYQDARDSFTRRAYESDRVLLAAAADTAAVVETPLWDRATLPHSATVRRVPVLAWRSDDRSGPRVLAFESIGSPGLLPTWRTVGQSVSGTDPMRSSGLPAPDTLPPITVSDSGRGYAIVSDPAHRLAAPDIGSFALRLAHAWNQQNPRLLFGSVTGPSPVLVTVRDVRERVARLAPMLHAGRHVSAVLHADSLWWVLDLYAVSTTYPLSEHVQMHGADVGAAQFAATAIVNAHSGRLILVDELDAPLLARRPLARLRRHLTPRSLVPASFLAALPPRADAIDLEAAIAAHAGSRSIQNDTSARARTAAPLGGLALLHPLAADSVFSGDETVPVWLPDRRVWALTAAAVDARGVLRGVFLAPGGADRRVRWLPSAAGATLDAVSRDIQEVTDSLRLLPGQRMARRGPTRIVPTGAAPRFVTPYFAVRDGRATQLAAVLLTDGQERGIGRTVEDAVLNRRTSEVPATGVTGTGTPAALYREMRDALRRGAWSEFGSRFDALGRALGIPPTDSAPQ